jgi:DNA processing protein
VNATDLRSPAGLLALQSIPRVGPKTALRLALFSEDRDPVLAEQTDRWADLLADAQHQLQRCEQAGVKAVSIFDAAYPERLRAIHDPPPLLFLHGSAEPLHRDRAIAVVGTREPTESGCAAAELITAAFATRGWAILSGLAKGIDTIAHRTALQHRAETVAALAAGLDHVYPKQNEDLAGAIVEHGGALIGEHPCGVPPAPPNFIQRNRIQTGLAAAVIVIQTGVAGGTMHTVRHAAAQGKPVFCAVPDAPHERNEGLRALLDTPADRLHEKLPAWTGAKALCARLGSEPLARPIAADGIEELIEALDQLASTDPQTVAEPRWWPPSDPPPRPGEKDEIAPDDAQASLFLIAD